MLLLDKQQRIAENGSIARFFSETFLDAEEAYDARKMTGIVYRGLVNAENRVRQRLTGEENETLEDSILQAVTSRRLNLDDWLENLPLAGEVKQEIDQGACPRVSCPSTAASASSWCAKSSTAARAACGWKCPPRTSTRWSFPRSTSPTTLSGRLITASSSRPRGGNGG